MTPLPIDPFIPQALTKLKQHRALVLVAEPGAGKTTRVPPAIVEAGLPSRENPNLVMLQPRRVAARASATRIADERGWELGREVGYHVRFERKLSAQTRLRVVTEGILNRQLLDDPFLSGIGCVVLDEFHERSIHCDLAIALLKEIRSTVRDDLMLVVMSATLDAGPVSRFLGDAPILTVPGKVHPVEITHLPPSTGRLSERVADAVNATIHEDRGHVLVFLPGAEEIRRTAELLEPLAERDGIDLRALHGSLPFEQQIAAIAPTNRRKIILATNIAETSLTIDGVTLVIDSGYARIAGYDAQRGLDRLDLKRISQASAKQRAGRAGRTAPGKCIRLWTAKEHAELPEFETPEIRRVDLCQTILAMHSWGSSNPRTFGWYEPPGDEAISSAERLLAMLGALTSEQNGRITDLGRRMLALPVHPRLARMMLEAQKLHLEKEAATMAALLSEKDILRSVDPRDRTAKMQGSSDLLDRMNLLETHSPELDRNAVRTVARTRDELLRLMRADKSAAQLSADTVETHLLRLLLLGFPDRVVRRRESDHTRGAMVGGGGVRLAGESVVGRAEFYLALDARRDDRSVTRESLVRIASAIEEPWLEELFPNFIRRTRDVIFDSQRQRVVGRGQVFFLDLLLREDRDAPVDPALAGKALAEALAPRAMELFESDEEAMSLIARINLLRNALPQHPWPDLSPAGFAEILKQNCAGRRSVVELQQRGFASMIQDHLVYPLDRLLEQHAPSHMEVPSGSRIRIDYSRTPPVLSVRLQELFGWIETPRIGGGKVAMTIELLGPNFRPVQVTQDLRSFWSNTYPQVRKDLRARYPKHSWPEDPFSAKPEAKGRHRPR